MLKNVLLNITIVLLAFNCHSFSDISFMTNNNLVFQQQDFYLHSLIKQDALELFEVWHRIYSKNYSLSSEEGKTRFEIFSQTLDKVRKNMVDDNSSYKIGLNAFADQTLEELAEKYLDLNMSSSLNSEREFLSLRPDVVKSSFENHNSIANYTPMDWREEDIFTNIRDQQDCGGCWAFASVGTIEALRLLKSKTSSKAHLSVQQLIDCDTKEKGCKGGWPSIAYNYVAKNGLVSDEDYPYEAKNGSCKNDIVTSGAVAKIESRILSCEEDECLNNDYQYSLLKNGPMAIVIDAYNTEFFNYKSGIYSQSCAEPNHAIILVGFGVDESTNTEYWIIRNSWGNSWGMNGYGYVKHEPKNYLSCNINRYGFQPKIIE